MASLLGIFHPSRPRHLDLGCPRLLSQLFGHGHQQLVGAIHVAQHLLDAAQQRLDLSPLGLDLVEQLRVVRLGGLQARV